MRPQALSRRCHLQQVRALSWSLAPPASAPSTHNMFSAVEPRKRRLGNTLSRLEPTAGPRHATRASGPASSTVGPSTMAEFTENFPGRPFLAVSKACWARTSARSNGVLIAAKRTERRVRRRAFRRSPRCGFASWGRTGIPAPLSGRQHNYSDVIRSHTSMRLRDMVPLTKGAICHEQALIALLLPMPSAQNSKPAHADIRHRIPMLCGPGSCCTRPRVWATTRSRRAWTHHGRWCPSGANASTTSVWSA